MHDHAHDHDHEHEGGQPMSCHGDECARVADAGGLQGKLLWVTGLTFILMVIEFLGGLWTHSLALLSDSAHMLSDVGSLMMTLFALRLAQRQATPEKSYGYQRAEILAAFINALIIIILATVIFLEAIDRFRHPQAILSKPMLLIAFMGLAVNALCIAVLHRAQHHSLNLRGAYLHIMSDLLGSVAAVGSGVLILTTNWVYADTVVSVLISILILVGGWRLLWDTSHILMQGTPPWIKQEKIITDLRALTNVASVKHLHVWRLASKQVVATVHITVSRWSDGAKVLAEARAYLREKWRVDHPTVQIEPADENFPT
jgi:cobalt-zinc-cadmium efflux system protein